MADKPKMATKARSTKRRGNGEGSIFQRSNGRWEAVITVGYNGQGKRVRRTVYGWTKKEVQDKLTELQSKKLDGSLAETGKLTVGEFLDRWLATTKSAIRATTYTSYEGTIRLHINPLIGGLPLQKLTPAHVQGLYTELERLGRSCYVLRLVHITLRRAFKLAVKWGITLRNVCDAVTAPRIDRREIAPLTTEQSAKLLQAATDDRLYALYVLALATGMRLGELSALQWEDVDLKAATVSVRRTLVDLKGEVYLAETKTKKSRRLIKLPVEAVEALPDHRKRMMAAGLAGCTYVFCTPLGGPIRRAAFHKNQFKPLLAAAGLPDCRFHDLRHTSATLMLAAGVHPKVMQERLGHSDINITLDIYSHVMPAMQQDAADKLGAMLWSRPTKALAGA